MGKSRKPVPGEPGDSTSNKTPRDETIAERYSNRPSPRVLFQKGADRPRGM